MEKTKQLKIVAVEWEDTFTYSDAWMHNDSIELEPYLVYSVGFLITENKDRVAISNGIHGERCISVVQIPRGCIRKMKILNFPIKYRKSRHEKEDEY